MKGAKALKPFDDKKVGKGKAPAKSVGKGNAKGGKVARDPNMPKRPHSAFFVFLEEFRKTFKKENPWAGVPAVGKAGGEKWKCMTADEKEPYEVKALKRKCDYEKLMLAYMSNKKQKSMAEVDDDESEKPTSEVDEESEQESMSEDDDESEKSSSEVDEESGQETCEAEVKQETCEVEDGNPMQRRKRGRSPILQAKTPNGLQKGSSCSRPLDKPTGALNNTIMNTEYQQVWPFIKQSAIWDTIESLESNRQPPQKPHFSPLKEVKADYREGLAISHFVTFENLFQKISKIQFTDPVDIIRDSLETLVNLETHGFDVGAVRACLNELLSWKDKAVQLRDMSKKDEEEFEKCKEEMNQLELRIKELQTKIEQNVMMENMKIEKVTSLQSNLHLLSKQILDCELAFKKLAAAPL